MPQHGSLSDVLGEQVFARAAGAPLRAGNQVRLLVNAAENYPAWLRAIEDARHSIYFETYFVRDDASGQRFADAFSAAAQRGAHVCVLYDWIGGLRTSSGFWKRLQRSGVEVRCFNRPRPDNIFSLLSRDHRKLLVVDHEVGFVGGLGVGDPWIGHPERRLEPWRDTGIELRGPAVVDLVEAFAENWVRAGGSLEATTRPVAILAPVAGDANVRVIATGPTESHLFRLDTLVAAAAREFLWLTDAYFVATNNYVQALAAAARDGVDVRLLLPGTSDLPLVRALSVIGYRPLLEAGVRIFEWNGTMLHAKTAVADGTWSRIGSSNVNPLSWWGNWELDLAIEHERVAADVAEMFLRDLKHSTEIVLDIRQRVARTKHPERPTRRRQRRRTRRAVAGAVGLGSTMRAALTNQRTLTPTEARVLAVGAVLLSALGWVALVYPRAVAWPLGIIAFSAALTVLLRAVRLFLRARSAREQSRS